ncbi:PIF1-like protein [Mya arenaria]|uniref:PIF1-like protein n=1 Tax=Mya arenaria TaxID=6604 RepID=A0ABY7FBL3_MYAAR|nr:PIF1-like protein [Mya arenaria]
MFSHKIVLNDNVRTKDEQLMKLITEVFSGGISADSEKFLASLKRPLPVYQASDSIKLFAKNDLVDDFNRTSLLDYPGDLYQFKSTDSEDISGIRTISAPEILWVKVGCPVILLQNLSDKLVNGLVGRIHSISVETGPYNMIPSLASSDGKKEMLDFHIFTAQNVNISFNISVLNPALNTNIAEREQYPLKPAFGLTIHKAQGMSLNRVEIDCQEIFRPGQLGVALSRATNSHGLRVINFHQRYLIKPPALITEFMRKESAEILQRRDDPARHVATGPGGDDQAHQVATGPGGDDQARHVATGPGGDDRARHVATAPGGDDQERHIYPEIHTAVEKRKENQTLIYNSELIASINTEENQALEIHFPEGFDLGTMRQGLKIEKEVTTSHKRLNEIVTSIDETKLQFFTKKLLVKLGIFAKSLLDKESNKALTTNSSIPEKNLSTFYSLVHKYNTSAEYRMHCWILFEEDNFSDEHMIICYGVLEFVIFFYIKQKVDLLGISSGHVSRRYVTNSPKLFSTSEECHNLYHEAKCKVNIINMLKEDEHYLNEHSQYPESLLDNQRIQ